MDRLVSCFEAGIWHSEWTLTLRSFLQEIERVASLDYEPSDGKCSISRRPLKLTSTRYSDDILHARVQTKGIVEQAFQVSTQYETRRLQVVDVAGVGGMKPVWAAHCDHASVSCSATL